MGCKDTVLPEPLLKNHNVNCLTNERNTRKPYNDNLCFFRAFVLHLHDNDNLEEANSIFFLCNSNCEEGDPLKVQGVHMNEIPKVEDLLQLSLFHMINISLTKNSMLNLLVEVFRKMTKVSSFYVTTTTFVTSTTSTQYSKFPFQYL